jgi:uncharacterized delta-60 repeat protein
MSLTTGPVREHVRRPFAIVLAVASFAFSTGAAHAAAGDPDPTFSGDGRTTTDFGAGHLEFGSALARQPDGKLVVAGSTRDDAGKSRFAVARYMPNGGLDPAFSGDGKTTTDFPRDFDFGQGVTLQPDGKIVVVGIAEVSPDNDHFAIARYEPNGAPDLTFSGDGKTTTNFAGGQASALDVVVQPDGRIVAAGEVGGGPTSRFALARYKPNGALDGTFSGDGKTTTDMDDGFERVDGLALQPDGRLVAGGFDPGPWRT